MGIHTDMIRAATASPDLKLANPAANATHIIELAALADSRGVQLLVLPELSISGYTCGDLFMQKLLLDACAAALLHIAAASQAWPSLVLLVGLPLQAGDQLYNSAAVIQGGRVLGAVPKQYLPNTGEFQEARWFTPGSVLGGEMRSIKLEGQEFNLGQQIFTAQLVNDQGETNGSFSFGIEICEDLWVPNPPSIQLALAGATVICNLSASNELAGKWSYRRQLVSQQSARLEAAYLYANPGAGESSTDLVFSAHSLIAEDGHILAESQPYVTGTASLQQVDLDLGRLNNERLNDNAFSKAAAPEAYAAIRRTAVPRPLQQSSASSLQRKVNPHPFVPGNPEERDERCAEIFAIQSRGLSRRINHIGAKTLVLGVSGGLDSTLALLVTLEAARLGGLPSSSVLGVTMPGFGTTTVTYNNAIELMAALDVTVREVNIKKSVLQHFSDIGHDESVHDVTYENSQARERTQILMDIANQTNGMVIGTGDMSELALGWATYNGDHMSMYGVNSSVPKTLVRFLIDWQADMFELQGGKGHSVARLLRAIRATPYSPELLPLSADERLVQFTETIIGPYELHDFYLYHVLRYGESPDKIFALARQAFSGQEGSERYSDEVLLKWLENFYRRFFANQFKRSCLPDGPKVGSVSLSPRGDWRMPSDASRDLWLAAVEELKEEFR